MVFGGSEDHRLLSGRDHMMEKVEQYSCTEEGERERGREREREREGE